MSELIEVPVAHLAGEALAWAVGGIEDVDLILDGPRAYLTDWRVYYRCGGKAAQRTERYNPQEDWRLLGALILKTKITPTYCRTDDVWLAGDDEHDGKTPHIAVCRAYVSGVVGESIRIPKVLHCAANLQESAYER